jgi:hypothetical protein
LAFRELGYVKASLYAAQSEIPEWRQVDDVSPPPQLTADDRRHQAAWPSSVVQGCRVYYAVACDGPWTRWLPLVKTGTTQISLEYLVTFGRRKILSGKGSMEVSLTAYGQMSALEYANMAEADAQKEFMKWITARIAETSGHLPMPATASAKSNGVGKIALAR